MYSAQCHQEQLLGSGGFSNVYKVTLNGKIYALKKIHPYLLKDESIKSAILKEIQIMKQIDHPNIIKFYNLIQNSESEFNLLLQYAEGGTLFQQLKQYQRLPQSKVIKYLRDIIKAIKYLHSRQQPILHRDIKPQNILITNNGECKLADFGSSNILDGQRNTFVGTKDYMAPEIIDSKAYGKEVDLWCLGVLIYELLIGQVPKQDFAEKIPMDLSRPAQHVVKCLLSKNPELRMTLEQLENHIWLVSQPLPTNLIKKQNLDSLSKSYQRKQNLIRLKQQQLQKKRKSMKNIQQQEIFNQNQQSLLSHEKLKSNQRQQLAQKRSLQSFEWVKLRGKLKIRLEQRKKLIINHLSQLTTLRLVQMQEKFRLQEKIKQYQKNIQLLQKFPLKSNYQYQNTIKTFLKKLNHLIQYLQYFPTRLQQQVCDFPQFHRQSQSSSINLPIIDEKILRLQNEILKIKKDVLIETIATKKRHKAFVELQEGDDAL